MDGFSDNMKEDIRNIQIKCIEILNIVDQICHKHNIQYSLCGGSVVGAHLYQGCLPWDDDVDLMMWCCRLERSIYECKFRVVPERL